jgi:hypothetical protein
MNPATPPDVAGSVDALAGQMAKLLRDLDPPARAAALAAFQNRVLTDLAANGDRLSPELLAWARAQFTEEELVAGLREVRETGGLQLADFLHELEREAAGE